MIKTERLSIRPIVVDDAEFLLALLNDESFIRFIGDRGVRDLPMAARYIQDTIEKSLRAPDQLVVVSLDEIDDLIGVCSFRKREELEDPDIGFAFLPEFRGHGYALEATKATLDYFLAKPDVDRVVAIVSPENNRSISLLNKLGYRRDREIQISSCSDSCSVLFVPVTSEK